MSVLRVITSGSTFRHFLHHRCPQQTIDIETRPVALALPTQPGDDICIGIHSNGDLPLYRTIKRIARRILPETLPQPWSVREVECPRSGVSEKWKVREIDLSIGHGGAHRHVSALPQGQGLRAAIFLTFFFIAMLLFQSARRR
jgi:hypothetical protein